MPRRTACTAVAALLVLATCGSDAPQEPAGSTGALAVVAAFAPLEELAREVGGDAVVVTGLVPPGQGAHDVELTASQLERVEAADVVLYLGSGFQPAVEQAVEAADGALVVDLLDSVTVLPVTPTLEGLDAETDGEVLADGTDPHVWLDPGNMILMAEAVADALTSVAPDRAAAFAAGAERYSDLLATLDREFSEGLSACESSVIVTSHRAFEYLARRYGLRQIPIAGISPSEEPSAKTLEAVAAAAEAEGVEVIYFEENLPDELARTLAAEVGASVDVLDPVEGFTREQLDAGADYLGAMRANLVALRSGLGCS